MSTLYQKLGGEAAVSAVVDKFYDFMLADPQINHFYKTADMEKLRSSQKEFITMVTGGPNHYQGTDMKKAHCKLNISKKDFALTWDHLAQALEFFKVDKGLIAEVKEIFYSVEQEIVKTEATNTQILQPSSKTDTNVKKPSGCPFKSSTKPSEPKAEGQKNHSKLTKDVYMKHYY